MAATILWKPVRFISSSARLRTAVDSKLATGPIKAKESSDILPPFKKHRDELSILKALSSGVREDPTGYSFRWVDDPLLLSRYQLRSYLTAKSAGIHAARYMLHSVPNIFAGLRSEEPKINRFSPIRTAESFIKEYQENNATAEQTLNSLIMLAASKDAWKFYSDLDKETTCRELPPDLIQSLLELLAATNGENIDLEKDCWLTFVSEPEPRFKPVTTWDRDGPAEILFRSLQKHSKASYCAIIRGCSKYFDLERALELEADMRKANFSPDLATYNAMLRCLFKLDEESGPYAKINAILTQMKKEGVVPNLETFVNITFTLRHSVNFLMGYAKSMLDVFYTLDIEPSLGLYANIIYRAPSDFVENLFDQLNEKDFFSQEIHFYDDFLFFYSAISTAINCNNVGLAHKINKYLVNTNRHKFLGTNSDANIYYMKLMKVQYQNDPLTSVMKAIWNYPQACNFGDVLFIISRIRKEGKYQLLNNLWEFLIAHCRVLGDIGAEGPLSTILNVVRSVGSDKVDFMPSINLLEEKMQSTCIENSLLMCCSKDSLHSNCIRYCLETKNVDAAVRWCHLSMDCQLNIPFSVCILLCESCLSCGKIDDAFYVLRIIKDRMNELTDVSKIQELTNKLAKIEGLNDTNLTIIKDIFQYLKLSDS